MLKRIFPILIGIITCFSFALSQENSTLVTYGPQASTREGDNDFIQVVFLEIPAAVSDSLYLRIFDADCGGRNDSRYGNWDTETDFRLMGGAGVYSSDDIKSPAPNLETVLKGEIIAAGKYGIDDFKDNQWFNFALFPPQLGERIGDKYYFKLAVIGSAGDDANVYDLALSVNPKRNIPPSGAVIFNYSPTIRLPETGVFAEMRFFVPEDAGSITVLNFDLAGAAMGVETAFRSNLPVNTSGQDTWVETIVNLDKVERNRLCALTFEGGREIPNDATFYIVDDKNEPLPIRLPIYIRKANNRPVPRIDIKPLSDPQAFVFDAAASTDSDNDAMNFRWDFGDGSENEGAMITHRFDAPGVYQGLLIVSDESGQVGCSSMKEFTVHVNLPPQADAGMDLIGAPGEVLKFNGSGSNDPDGKLTKFYWDFGDGSKTEGISVTHSYKRAGHYQVTLKVIDDSDNPNNFDIDETHVWINAPPVVEIGEDIICSIGETIQLSGRRSFDSDGEIISYVWNLGDDAQKSGMDIDHAYSKPGKYRVVLRIEDNAGTGNSFCTDYLTVFVNDPPIAKIAVDKNVVSVGEVINFNGKGSSDSDGKIIDFRWDFGDGFSAQGTEVTHSYQHYGRYNVKLTVQDNSTSNSDLAHDNYTIIVNYPPIARAGGNILTTISEVKFSGLMSEDFDGEITAYHWDFGDGFSSSEPAPAHVYGNPGVYTVKLTVTDDSKTSSDRDFSEIQVTINHLPIADPGPSQIAAPGELVTFDGGQSIDFDGEITQYRWTFGDGGSGEGKTVTHQYSKPGYYTVTLEVFDNTGHSEAFGIAETYVHVNSPPAAIAGIDITAAPGDKINLDGSRSYDIDGKITAYWWEFSDGAKKVEAAKTTRIFDNPGVYTAKLSVKDNSGASNSITSDELLIKINHQPIAAAGEDIFTNNPAISFDGSASGDADGDALTYIWDFGDGSPAGKGVKQTHNYGKGGRYPVILTVDDGAGLANSSHSASINVIINEPPKADAGKDTTICAGDVVIFDGSHSVDPEGGVLKFVWDFGDGTSAEGMNPVKTFTKGGIYKVILRVIDDSGLPGNDDIDQIVVRAAESPVADAGSDQTACVNREVHFDGTGSTDIDGLVNSYFWDFGDGSTGGGPTPTHVYTRPGTFRIVLTITGDKVGECNNTDSDEMLVTVHDAPTAKFDCPALAADGARVEFDASMSESRMAKIVKWEWDFGDGTSGGGVKTSHVFEKPGRYIVTLKVTSDSQTEFNSSSARQLVVINAAPAAEAGENIQTGLGDFALFNGGKSIDSDGAVTSYRWEFGDGASAEGVQVRHKYMKSGRYNVKLTVKDNTDLSNNQAEDSLYVTVNASPVPVIRSAEWAGAGENIIFDASESIDPDGSIQRCIWSFSDGHTAEGKEVSYSFSNPGKYQAALLVDDGTNVVNSLADTTVIININHPPIASGGNDRNAGIGEELTFDASASSDKDGKLIQYLWDFADGSAAEGIKVKHSYSQPGIYVVTLRVQDDSNTKSAVGEDAVRIRVNSPPVIVTQRETECFTGGANDFIRLDASGSYDSDGDPLIFKWDFGDGVQGEGPIVIHKYLKPGGYSVKLTVSDNTGAVNEKSQVQISVKAMIR
ncbi:PKD domain-containing protein [bacterium]|nr:PKD domain-containing protein [bacterium]